MDSKSLRFNGHKDIYSVFTNDSVKNLIDSITVTTAKGGKSTQIPIGWFLYSLPFYHEESKKFYRFDQGLWFHVHEARFEPIKRILRNFKMPSKELGLPGYCLDDILGEKEDYKEIRYNKRAVVAFNQIKGQEAFLLDRLNVSIGQKQGHLFEFGDILLIKNGHYYIIHVKRAGANSLSHHREQVERSADFLGSNLNKHENSFLFIRSAIEDLYRQQGLKNSSKDKGYTHSNIFRKIFQKSKAKNIQELLQIEKSDPDLLSNFKKCILGKLNQNINRKSFFENNLIDFCIALDALYDCTSSKKDALNSKREGDLIENFFDRVKIALEGSKALFSKGLSDIKNRKKVTLVLAVIDDNGVENNKQKILEEQGQLKETKPKQKFFLKTVSDEIRKKESHTRTDQSSALFKNQDLWGLDRTRMQVLKYGFDFKMCVTNEEIGKDWDAFKKISSKLDEDSDVEDTQVKLTPYNEPTDLDQKKSMFSFILL